MKVQRGLKDAIYGASVGDAFGVPYEFHTRGSYDVRDEMIGYGTYDLPLGTFSDDTSMLLATCDSIKHTGTIDINDMRKRFEAWAFEGEYTPDGNTFGIGNTTLLALKAQAGLDGQFDNGNGSLMRIAPLAFIDATDEEIRQVSAITHAHPLSCDTCVDFCHLLREAQKNPAVVLNALQLEFAPVPEAQIKSTGYVADTWVAARWCVGTTDSYAQCIKKAVELGDDTDTTACVAGALAGVLYGIGDIPISWIRELRGKDIIDACLF